MVVQVVSAVGDVVVEPSSRLQIGLRQHHVSCKATAFPLARLGADPEQVPVSGLFPVRAVLDVVPLRPELVQQQFVDLSVVPDGVHVAAGFGDVEEDQVAVVGEVSVAVADVGGDPSVPQPGCEFTGARRRYELYLPVRFLRNSHQARALHPGAPLFGSRAFPVFVLAFAPEVELCSSQSADLPVSRGFDDHAAHRDFDGAEGG